MDVTFHETKSFFISPTLQGDKAFDAGKVSFSWLPYLSLYDAQDPTDEVTTNWIKPNISEEEDEFFGKKYHRKPTLTLELELWLRSEEP